MSIAKAGMGSGSSTLRLSPHGAQSSLVRVELEGCEDVSAFAPFDGMVLPAGALP